MCYLACSAPRVTPFDVVEQGEEPVQGTSTLALKDAVKALQEGLQHSPAKHHAALHHPWPSVVRNKSKQQYIQVFLLTTENDCDLFKVCCNVAFLVFSPKQEVLVSIKTTDCQWLPEHTIDMTVLTLELWQWSWRLCEPLLGHPGGGSCVPGQRGAAVAWWWWGHWGCGHSLKQTRISINLSQGHYCRWMWLFCW